MGYTAQKILVVDDTPANNMLIKAFFNFPGVEIFMAESGQKALEHIRNHQFCLIILDIMMPVMNGYELAEKIRKIENCKLIPIIFLTANHNDQASMLKGYALGAVDYLAKPIIREVIVQKARFFLQLDKQKQEIIYQKNKLAESKKRFFDIANSVNGWIWEVDNRGQYVYVSDKIESVLGFRPDEVIGKTALDLMYNCDLDMTSLGLEELMKLNEPITDWLNWKCAKNGEKVCFLSTAVPIFDEDNNPIGYRGVDKDITESLKAREEIDFQAKLLQNVNDSIIYVDLEGIIQYVNAGTIHTFGYSPGDLIGNVLAHLFPEQHKDFLINELFVVIDFKPYQSVWQGKNKAGEIIWLDVKINLMRLQDDKPEGYIVVSKDISARIVAEEKAVAALIVGEDKERQRIASDLHDGLGQLLTASFYNFSGFKDEVNGLNLSKLMEYHTGLELLEKAIVEVRNISHNLMPKSIERFGLLSTVKALLNSFLKNSAIEVTIVENIKDIRFSPHVEINLYRITQEILHNAIKHSKASKLHFQFQVINNEILFLYSDNGIGFNYYSKKYQGDGLMNIQNRVKSMSGFLSFNSKPGKGTTISIELKTS